MATCAPGSRKDYHGTIVTLLRQQQQSRPKDISGLASKRTGKMRISMMLLVVLVVFTALATAKPHFQSRSPRCRVGSTWPADDGCNTCTCRSDGKSYACTRGSCNSINSLQSRVDEGLGQGNSEDGLQALDALAQTNTEHGKWEPFDISQYLSFENQQFPLQ